MKDLYIDCDGVIFNTINIAFLEMKKIGVDLTNDDAITNYFRNCNWSKLIDEGGTINDSIEKIKIMIEEGCFDYIAVATHRCSYNEGLVKTNKFKELIPSLKIITIPKRIGKHHAIPVQNNILIDDALDKIINWVNHGGIGIYFRTDVNKLIYPGEVNNDNYFITNDLLDALVVNSLYKEKTYSKKL